MSAADLMAGPAPPDLPYYIPGMDEEDSKNLSNTGLGWKMYRGKWVARKQALPPRKELCRGRLGRGGRIWIDRSYMTNGGNCTDASIRRRVYVHADPHPLDSGHKFIDRGVPYDEQLPQRAERTGGNGRTRGSPGGGGLADPSIPLLGGAPLATKLKEIYSRSDSEDDEIFIDGKKVPGHEAEDQAPASKRLKVQLPL